MMESLSRARAILGEEASERLSKLRVLLVGVGGVGSWCAEALVRTGLKNLILMDDDIIVESNVNRQSMATCKTIGAAKVEAMEQRLRDLSPDCRVQALKRRFERAEQLDEFAVDLVIDAIDDVSGKAQLILGAAARGLPIISSMGAALRFDPTKVKVSRFEKVEGDGLARALRNRFRKLKATPRPWKCVWSSEAPISSEERGSLMQVTAAFGLAIASEVVNFCR